MEDHEKECSFLFSHKDSPEQQRGGGVVGSQEGQLHTLHVSLFMRLYLSGVPCAHCFYQSSGWRCEANVVQPKLKYCSPATPFTPLPVSFRRVWSFIPGLQNIAQCLIQINLWTMASRDCHWPHSLNMKLPRWPNQSISFPGLRQYPSWRMDLDAFIEDFGTDITLKVLKRETSSSSQLASSPSFGEIISHSVLWWCHEPIAV